MILFVGDGMGIATVTAARILAGQRAGKPGEENRLSFETLPFTALSKTYNTDFQVPDSAGTMTAMTTGVKTRMGVLGVDDTVARALRGGAPGLPPRVGARVGGARRPGVRRGQREGPGAHGVEAALQRGGRGGHGWCGCGHAMSPR